MKITTQHDIFISYNGILKIIEPYLLETIRNPMFQDRFSNVLDYNKFLHLDFKNLIRLCIQRTDENVFKYVAFDNYKESYDFNKLYNLIYSSADDLITYSPQLLFAHHLQFLASRQFIKNIYIYSESYDDRIKDDIEMTFITNKNKFKYVYGDIDEIIKTYNADMYVVPNIDFIGVLNNNNKLLKKEILLAKYGFNFQLNKSGDIVELRGGFDKLINEKIFKLQMFSPMDMDETFFTQSEETFG